MKGIFREWVMEIYNRGDLQENRWNSQAQERELGQKPQIMSNPRHEGEIWFSLWMCSCSSSTNCLKAGYQISFKYFCEANGLKEKSTKYELFYCKKSIKTKQTQKAVREQQGEVCSLRGVESWDRSTRGFPWGPVGQCVTIQGPSITLSWETGQTPRWRPGLTKSPTHKAIP